LHIDIVLGLLRLGVRDHCADSKLGAHMHTTHRTIPRFSFLISFFCDAIFVVWDCHVRLAAKVLYG